MKAGIGGGGTGSWGNDVGFILRALGNSGRGWSPTPHTGVLWPSPLDTLLLQVLLCCAVLRHSVMCDSL